MLRRARIKLAPNVGAASRQQKVASETPSVEPSISLEDSTGTVVTSPVVPENVEEVSSKSALPTSLPSVEAVSSVSHLPAPLPPSASLPPPHEVECGLSSTDKENLIDSTSKEKSHESQNKEPTVVAGEENIPASSSSVSRFKARNKVQPVIRESSHRIRTFSSASESEEDAGRRKTRTPLSPVKKSVMPSKKDAAEISVANAEEPELKGKKRKKKAGEKTKLELKKEAMKKKFANGQVDRSKMTMFDLIYNNPVNTDEPPRPKEKIQMRLKPYEIEALAKENQEMDAEATTGNPILDEMLAEEDEIRRDEERLAAGLDEGSKADKSAEEEDRQEDDLIPAPQVRVGPDGEIILDDRSLVIDTTQTKKDRNQLANAPVVVENSSTAVNYGSWRKRKRSARWSTHETARFHLALRMLGTNFSLMEKLFPKRTRIELKRKFKSEERCNRELIDKATTNQIPLDLTQFEDDSDDISEAETDLKRKRKVDGSKSKSALGKKRKKSSEENPSVVAEGDLATAPDKPTKKRGKQATKKVADESTEASAFKEPATKKPRSEKKSKSSAKKVLKNSENGLDALDEGQSGTPTKSQNVKKSDALTNKKKTRKSKKSDESVDPPTSESGEPLGSEPPAVGDAVVHPSTEVTATPLSNLLQSPLGVLGLEQGGLTVVESSSEKQPSFLVPQSIAEANPAFAHAQPGSLVLVSTPNPTDPEDQLVHVYRVALPVDAVPT